MSDLDLVLQALRDEARWAESGDQYPATEATIGYTLRRVADRIAELRSTGVPACQNCGCSCRDGDAFCLACMLAGAG